MLFVTFTFVFPPRTCHKRTTRIKLKNIFWTSVGANLQQKC